MRVSHWKALAAAVALTLALASGAVAAEPLTLTWVTENTPSGNYIVGGGTVFRKDRPGIEIELYRLVAEKLGFQLKMKRLPWKLCLSQLEHNQVEGVFPATFTPDRMKIGAFPMKDGKVDPSRRTRTNAYYLYKLKSSGISWNGNYFSGASGLVAVPMGGSIVANLKKRGLDIKEVPLHAESPDLLRQKRVTGFICLETVFDVYLKRGPEKFRDIVKVSPPVWEKPGYLMLSRKFVKENPKLARKIWDSIRSVKQSAKYRALLRQYLD